MRRLRPATKVAVAVGVGALVVSTIGLPSAAEPVRMLQTVVVDLSSDGSIPAIEVIDLTRGQGSGDSSRDERDLDPSDRASDLPISVRTAYRTADGVGTDLADVAGRDDPVTVSINVTNQTGRVEQVSVTDRFSGDTHTEEVVVTTPMTVILTAVLPGDLGADIDREGTNGAVSRRDGDTVVQWGAVLAPPAVQGTATFTLDLRGGTDLELRDMALTVEPGVRSDFSVDRVVEEVFGGRAQADDGATLDTAEEVETELDGIAESLEALQDDMTAGATKSGREIVTSLTTSTEGLKGQVEQLRSSVESLLAQFEGESTSSLARAGTTLASRVDEFIARIGFTPGAGGVLVPLPPPRDEGPAETVTEIVGLAQELLVDGDPADGDRIVDLASELERLVSGPCTGTKPSLTCEIGDLRREVIDTTQAQVTSTEGALGIGSSDLLLPIPAAEDAIDDAAAIATNVHAILEGLDAKVMAVVADVAATADRTTLSVADIDLALAAVAQLQIDLGDVSDEIEGLRTLADQATGDLGSARDLIDDDDGSAAPVSVTDAVATAEDARSTLVTAIADLATDLCGLPEALLLDLQTAGVIDVGEETDALDVIEQQIAIVQARIAEVDCSALSPEATAGLGDLLDLAAGIDLTSIEAAGAAALVEIDEAAAGTTTLSGQASALLGPGGGLAVLADGLSGVDLALQAARADLVDADSDPNSVDDLLVRVRDALDRAVPPPGHGLRQQIAVVADMVGGTGPPTLQGHIQAAEAAVQRIEQTADAALTTLERTIVELTRASTEDAEDLAGEFLEGAQADLRNLRDRLETVYGKLAEPTRELDVDAATTGTELERIALDVRARIAELTGRTNSELAATARELDASSRAVYLNLTGSATPNVGQSGLAGGGFQGVLRGQLADLAIEEVALEATMGDTASFRGIRHTRYVARLVRQAQQQAGQDRLVAAQPFDGEVEDGSVVGTVFVFRFEEVG